MTPTADAHLLQRLKDLMEKADRQGGIVLSGADIAALGTMVLSECSERVAEARKDALKGLPDAETLAEWFHESYERLAGTFHYQTRTASAVPWDDVPSQNKALMIATAREVKLRLIAAAADQPTSHG